MAAGSKRPNLQPGIARRHSLDRKVRQCRRHLYKALPSGLITKASDTVYRFPCLHALVRIRT